MIKRVSKSKPDWADAAAAAIDEDMRGPDVRRRERCRVHAAIAERITAAIGGSTMPLLPPSPLTSTRTQRTLSKLHPTGLTP